jgi:hypothetical protein
VTSPVRLAQPWPPQPWGATNGGSSTDTKTLFVEKFPSMRLINWIWHVRGSLALAPGQSSDDAFDRLAPLFRETGTSHERANDTLTFRKKDQAAQDKMSVFDGGVLRIEKGAAESVLHYHLISRALLFCFLLAPLFLGIAQFTIVMGKFQKPATEVAGTSGKAAKASKKPAAKADADKAAPAPLNPIDKFLGAPAPEKPKKGEEKPGRRNKKPSPTPAYVFAAIFATLYVIGRILEDRLIKTLFRKRLLGSQDA